jgi:hypothetical protein
MGRIFSVHFRKGREKVKPGRGFIIITIFSKACITLKEIICLCKFLMENIRMIKEPLKYYLRRRFEWSSFL